MKSELKVPEFTDNKHWHWVYDSAENYLTKEGLDFFNSYEILDIESQIFCGWPSRQSAIHVDARVLDDGTLRGKSWAINYVWNVEDSDMIWYEPLVDSISTADSFNPNKIKFNTYKEHEVREIERVNILGLALIRINIPHAVINRDPVNYRYCLSLRDKTHMWTWEEAVEKFKPYIV